ncbi:Rna recognition motif-containing protein [Cardiosporidium cionae]|uniref:Rna recognition motif-containing protein n=1 Tax=Cardiosporidium cionae TaxID=476202 RepID=A0ABQ7JAI2_9APIC|nr:Rna recognition motif-containing protein [Cardiosporidium cionae]|eukprot:KAF8821012.1 Rna recognition motif-containing protein [Cardiosporidium cionae]
MYRNSMNKRTLVMDIEVDGLEEVLHAKRQQMANEEQPSRVLLLNNLARGVTEIDVEAFVKPFTRNLKPKIYLQASGGRAFVEFADETAAANALDYFSQHPIHMKGTQVQVTYSTHNNVTTLEEKSEPFKVLLASVTNLLYPVDMDLMHFLFSKYGQVEKIVTFSKSPTMYQALIQFTHPDHARQALVALHNRNIYDGCNTLQIQQSRLSELVVKANSVKSWDYRSGQVPSSGYDGRGQSVAFGSPTISPYGSHGAPGSGGNGGLSKRLPREIRELNLESTNRQQTPVLICYNLPEGINVSKLFNLFSLYGSVFRVKILREKADTALVQYSDPLYANIAQCLLQGANVMGNEIQIRFSKNLEVKMPASESADGCDDTQRNKEFSIKDQRYGVDDIEKYAKGACKPTQTLFVANIHGDATKDDVTKLFSAFGTVSKSQIKPPKEGSQTLMAIVGMGSEVEALSALMQLHNTYFQSRNIKVAFSKTVLM